MELADRIRSRVAPLYERAVPYDPCHDMYHVDRVARNAERIAREEGADASVCLAAAYLHDLDRVGSKDAVVLRHDLSTGALPPVGGPFPVDPIADARAHLAAIGAPADWSARVLEAVERHKDKSFAPGGKRAMSLEAKVVGDADKLEAIGAIGIARAFSFGGLKGRALWDGKGGIRGALPPESATIIEGLEAEARERPYVSGAMGSTIDHFFEKLLRLQDDFNTETGRRLGKERTEFLRVYLDRFFAEWGASA